MRGEGVKDMLKRKKVKNRYSTSSISPVIDLTISFLVVRA